MATLTGRRAHWRIVATKECELALLPGQGEARRVMIDGGLYPAADGAVGLPQGISQSAAWRICRAFERAAVSDASARLRRQAFTLIPNTED